MRLRIFGNHHQIHKSVELDSVREVLYALREEKLFLNKRSSHPWGHWDNILRFYEWTKHGVPPVGAFRQNIGNLITHERLQDSITNILMQFRQELVGIPNTEDQQPFTDRASGIRDTEHNLDSNHENIHLQTNSKLYL